MLAMEALNALFCFPDTSNMLTSLCSRSNQHRVSPYIDDLVIFLVLVEQDIKLVRVILDIFAGASSLHTNIHKCQFTPIQCSET
jgi:hypothetical protein